MGGAALCSLYPVFLFEPLSKRRPTITRQRKGLTARPHPHVLLRHADVAVGRDLRVRNTRECTLERLEEIPDCLAWSGAGHSTGKWLPCKRKQHRDSHHFRSAGALGVSACIPAPD